MNQITNSTLKEQIRQRNENEARGQESQIQIQLANDINNLTPKAKYKVKGWLIGGAVFALITGSAVNSSFALVAFAAVIGTWIYLNYRVKLYNENLDAVKARLQDDASNRIRQAYTQADQRTQQEIAAYENDVKMYAKKVLNKADGLTPMVDHVVNMFQRMISHADAGSHMKFIEADFYFQVINTGIKYSYQSRYTNPQDDYNFNKARYRDLSQVQDVYLKVLFDTPWFYYINQTVVRITGQIGYYILLPEYLYTNTEIERLNQDIQNILRKIDVKACQMLSNEFRLEKYLHDSVVKSVAYDYDSLKKTDCFNAHSIVGAFLDKKAVCEGIAKAFKLLA